jgi:hypothetical protein
MIEVNEQSKKSKQTASISEPELAFHLLHFTWLLGTSNHAKIQSVTSGTRWAGDGSAKAIRGGIVEVVVGQSMDGKGYESVPLHVNLLGCEVN